MHKQILTLILTISSLTVFGQNSIVTYDRQMAVFNGNQPLPAEKPFIVQGNIDQSTKMVKLAIVGEGALFGESDFVSSWIRPEKSTTPEFSLPVSYPLRGGKDYDFLIAFYARASDEEISNLRHSLYTNITNYLDLYVESKKERVILAKPSKMILSDLNEIIRKGLQQYASLNAKEFEGFSDIVKGNLEKLDGLSASESDIESAKNSSLNKVLELMITEVEHYLRSNLLVIEEQQLITDYPVEQTRRDLDLAIGYAGVWFQGGVNELSYGSAPFLGVSVPFGNQVFAGDFWSNLSLDFGVMLTDMENADNQVVSGPVVKRPILAGLSYKMFRFVRINAGVAVVETRTEGGGFIQVDNINAKPYIGLSAGISLWMDFRE